MIECMGQQQFDPKHDLNWKEKEYPPGVKKRVPEGETYRQEIKDFHLTSH